MVIVGNSTLSGKVKSYQTGFHIGHVTGKVKLNRSFTLDIIVPPIIIDYSDMIEMADKLRKLLDIYRSKQTNKLIEEYDYDELAFEINEENPISELGLTLQDLFNSVTESLDQALIQIRDNEHLTEENEDLQELREIINDTDKLKDYLESRNKSQKFSSIFSIPDIKVDKTPVLREDYAEYIVLYGFPEYGVFDADKISEIRKRLGIDPSTYKRQWL